jgi:transaldolase/glucose-6-phosphate isomerase
LLAGCAREGRDKVTLLLPPTLEALGGWIEQLVAESTGKSGRGLIPVDGEPAGVPGTYGADRVFVRFHLAGDRSGNPLESLALALEGAAHPIERLQLPTPEDLAAEFFRWEMATAFAGALLAVNPFDEPDVADSKARTKAALERPGPPGAPVAARNGIELLAPAARAPASGDPVEALRSHLASAREGDAVTFLAFLHRTPRRHAMLSGLRLLVRDRLRRATTLGYGPRYLHSSGQLHKGGPDRAVFVLITAEEDGDDVPVPGAPWGFRALHRAQARGDLETLVQRGRRVIALHLARGADEGLQELERALAAAL